jgi:hypothetical protein
VPTASNYVASVSSLNTLGSESSPATLTFTIGDAPTGTPDIKDDAIVTNKILDGNVTDAKINSITANKITAGTIDASQITVTNLDADNITSGTLATARLNVNDIISTGSIIVSGDNISDLTNDSAFINGGQVNSNVTSISGGVITTGIVNTARLNVSDIISTGSIIVSGDNISDLTNNSGYVDATGAASAAPVQSVAGATGAVSASTIITAGNIVVQGDNISDLTNDSSFINGGQVNTNVTSISGGVITTGTINGSVVNVTNINADNVSTGTLNANRIQIDDVTIDTDGSGNLIIKSGGVDTNQLADASVNNDKIDSISATKITADQLDSARINVGTLNVEHFGDVSADIKSHLATETFVPLEVFGSVIQRGSTNFTVNTNSTGTYLSLTMNQIRDGAKYRAILTGVYGDCTAGYLEYSLNGTTWTQAAGGVQNITFAAGTFRTYVFAYSGTISGLSSTQSTVYWRLRWVTKLNSTYQSLYVFIDNTQ